MAVVGIVDAVLGFYGILILAYVILSWFQGSGWVAELYSVLAQICEPYVGLFRRIVPSLGAGGAAIDFSPLVALLVLNYLIRPAVRSILVAVL